MKYAKVNDSTVIKYPYDMVDLEQENPNTSYDSRHTVAEWYNLTEESEKTGNKVVEVSLEKEPNADRNEYRVYLNEIPSLIDNSWVLQYTVQKLAQTEIDEIINEHKANPEMAKNYI